MPLSYVRATPRSRQSHHRLGPVQAVSTKPQPLEFVRNKTGGTNARIQNKKLEEGSFRRLPLVAFGADAGRSFADHTTGVRPRRCRWHSGTKVVSEAY